LQQQKAYEASWQVEDVEPNKTHQTGLRTEKDKTKYKHHHFRG
jgi:hypothetical protein